MIERTPLSPEEMALSYSKYYFIDPDPTDPVALQCLREPLPAELIVDPANVANMFRPGYDSEAMMGWHIGDGWGYSTLYTRLPGVSIEMLDWWFTWFAVRPPSVKPEDGNLRYKIWNPGLHFDQCPADQETYERFCNPDIPMRLRREPSSIIIREKLSPSDPTIKEMRAHATPHSALALPDECWEYINACGTLTVAASDHSVMLQFFRKIDTGCELIIRTWRGYVLNDEGKIVKLDGFPTPTKEHLVADLVHNLTEMPHLAKFLPRLYAEEGNKPVGAY